MMLVRDQEEEDGDSGQGRLNPARIHPAIADEPEDDHDEDYDEFPDARSIASDDSFYPPDGAGLTDSDRGDKPGQISFLGACSSNKASTVTALIRQGVAEEEVRETDKNRRSGLIVACYQGYVDVVMALSSCPHLDVNWQDNEGNTALITASQAGHSTITNYLLNYYPGLDIEARNCHGFTALMKAAMQGRVDCVRALIMAGADLQARDEGRRLTPHEWALFTSRYEAAAVMQRLARRPCPEQCCDWYRPEWPSLPALVARARQPKGCVQKVVEALRRALDIGNVTEASEGGVLDHMVRVTTAIGSPFVATSCRTVCPESPPRVGKRRPAVQEILRGRRPPSPGRLENRRRLFQNSRVALVPETQCRRSSLLPQAPRRGSLVRVRPGPLAPKLRISRAPRPTYEPERPRRRSSAADGQFLQLPKWRYKELKEERRRAEEAERKRVEARNGRTLAPK